MTEKENIVINKFIKYVTKNKVTKTFLVEIFKLSGYFLNIKTISDYSRENNLSYQGTKKCRNIITIHNVKWVIDND